IMEYEIETRMDFRRVLFRSRVALKREAYKGKGRKARSNDGEDSGLPLVHVSFLRLGSRASRKSPYSRHIRQPPPSAAVQPYRPSEGSTPGLSRSFDCSPTCAGLL